MSTLERDYGIHAKERVKLWWRRRLDITPPGTMGALDDRGNVAWRRSPTADHARFQSGAQAYAGCDGNGEYLPSN